MEESLYEVGDREEEEGEKEPDCEGRKEGKELVLRPIVGRPVPYFLSFFLFLPNSFLANCSQSLFIFSLSPLSFFLFRVCNLGRGRENASSFVACFLRRRSGVPWPRPQRDSGRREGCDPAMRGQKSTELQGK